MVDFLTCGDDERALGKAIRCRERPGVDSEAVEQLSRSRFDG
ncbi:hypothetical protein [Curtanaerobium respiraculi]|nr:hypothetical protein [Curtanaerobium respiraculi]